MLCVNVGCGTNATPGWVNLDNSSTVKMARTPLAFLLSGPRADFAKAVVERGVRWADASRLKFTNSSVDVIYSSHMVEHMSRYKVDAFIKEAKRVLKPGGVLRLALPDLKLIVDEYLHTGDADRFMDRTLLSSPLDTLSQRVSAAISGTRHHLWMYDGASLKSLLEHHGFKSVTVLEAGETTIPDANGLNLREREEESVYVEGVA